MEGDDKISIMEIADWTVLCRVCLKLPNESEMLDLNIIYDEEEQFTYHDCFAMCTQINIGDDESMPQNLCRGCGLELQMAYDFYKKVEESKRFLSHLQEQQPEMTIATTEELYGSLQEGELEEQIDIEEYQSVEQLDEEDEETEQIKINKREEYDVVTLVTDEEDVMDDEISDENAWRDAVVTVANEQHLPTAVAAEQLNTSVKSGVVKTFYIPSNYEEELLEFEIDEPTPEKATATRETKSKSNLNKDVVPARSHYFGKYKCDYCMKVFPNHSRMVVHRRSHESDRPKYPCEHCDRLYATKQAMDVHVRSVHIKNGFVCPICSKLYVIKKSLEVHMRYHTGDFPFVCDMCGKKFAQIGHLNTHVKVKHNSVRFSCEYPNCGKYFTSSTSLRNHEFSHGEMPFECTYCEKGYPSKSKLKVHIRRKHHIEMTLEDLEPMRKFKTSRAKLSVVKVIECEV